MSARVEVKTKAAALRAIKAGAPIRIRSGPCQSARCVMTTRRIRTLAGATFHSRAGIANEPRAMRDYRQNTTPLEREATRWTSGDICIAIAAGLVMVSAAISCLALYWLVWP